MRQPIKYGKRGRVTLDVLALQEALESGTLCEEDRVSAEALLPGICDQIGKRILALGPSGKVADAVKLIDSARRGYADPS